jgi:hypothetical protein
MHPRRRCGSLHRKPAGGKRLVAASAYELPLGPVGGFPGGAMHTKGKEQGTVEAELRATVDHELLDEAGQAKVRVSAGLPDR